MVDPHTHALAQGYKAQSGRVVETLERLVAGCEARRESLVVEGVHLSLNFVVRLMQRHPSIIPFLIHISNETKHRERFAARPCRCGLRFLCTPSTPPCCWLPQGSIA